MTRRVLFDALSLDEFPSGTKTRLLTLAPEAARRGYETAVLHAPGLDAAARRALGGLRLIASDDLLPRDPFRRVRMQTAAWRRAADAFSPDVVVNETFPMPAPPDAARLVAVVHDLRRVGSPWPLRAIFRRLLADAGTKAARWHTPSAVVRDRLVQEGVPADRVDVVPNAVLPRDPTVTMSEPLPKAASGARFVFCLGHAEARKDFSIAAKLAASPRFQGRLVFLRAGRGRAGDRSLLELGAVTDAVRDALYSEAAVVFAPSKLEGFGLAPLEALASGGRVLASEIAAHREVLGDAADYFPVGDVPAAAAAIEAILAETEGERSVKCAAGRARADLWSVRRAVDAFIASLARLP